jgi:hypothetical protein
MKSIAALVAVTTMISTLPAPAMAGHLLPSAAVDRALSDASEARARDAARFDALLSSDEAAQAAGRLGVSIDTVRRAATRLSDAERQDLLNRAQALSRDPVAGYMDRDIHQLLVILLIVVIVVVLLQAID